MEASFYVFTDTDISGDLSKLKDVSFDLYRTDMMDIETYEARKLGYSYKITEQEYERAYLLLVEVKEDLWSPRIDSETGEQMWEGWIVFGEYYKTQEQVDRVAKEAGYKSFSALHKADDDNYWTEWFYDLEDYMFPMEVYAKQTDGSIKEIVY